MAQTDKPIAEGQARPLDLTVETEPMEARLADDLPQGPEWQYEPKWDGFRCLAFRDGEHVDIRAKSGKPLGRFFPEVVDFLRRLPAERFVLDGELVIEVAGQLSFGALQARLHPAASRIAKLSKDTPARLVAFDLLLTPGGEILLDRSLSDRRRRLAAFLQEAGSDDIRLSPATDDIQVARSWLSGSGSGATDGVVAKRLTDAYQPGERAMVKVKPLRSADCVVGGFRYQNGTDKVGSLLLGLYDEEGRLDHVGFTATISNAERAALTARLEALCEAPGFTGNAPGGPSRWTTDRSAEWQPLKPELVVEVRFDQVTDRRFRHGTKLLRWRPDKKPSQCTFEQIAPPSGLADLSTGSSTLSAAPLDAAAKASGSGVTS